ncbi:carboxymuconolactone decarboxylase family protein [uncultured Maritimibacter sp.]|jgi:AhpD family alkylhydroperoxidase|uniref:carboxymuconolactone decarboxylase family protein n=1 Tax=uncultured Maritimibacter sp. TaxID=991866 RepID=UPI000AF404F5|nr:carboxymuconolactone decarboxylase family protein [uncultured Maritimibacter sp.]
MDYAPYLANTTANLDKIRKIEPDTASGFAAMHRAAFYDGDVSKKHKELMALAIAVAKGCTDCIGFHVRAAIKAGVTRKEMTEMIAVAVLMGGGPAYMYGAHVIEAYDQMAQPA